MRIDLHVHSKHSTRPSQWILKKIGCPESFTEPLQIYRIAKSRGMSHVTITDHNTIDGALEIAHLPDTFIGEEITTYFPENGCKIHVLALDIDEKRHAEIQKLRENIYELTAYFQRENILNIVAHPLYAVNDRLGIEQFEKLLLLFRNFELNGARNQRENDCLKAVVDRTTQGLIEELADRYDMAPLYENPWQKRLWGGSDDHSSLNIARTYTTIDLSVHAGIAEASGGHVAINVVGRPATPLTMAHNLYGIAYQFYRDKFNLNQYADKDPLMRFLDRNLRVDENRSPGVFSKIYLLWQYRREKKNKAPLSDSLISLLKHETRQLIEEDRFSYETATPANDFIENERRWFSFVNRASKGVMLHFGNHLLDHLSGANVFNIFATLGSAGGMYTLLAPFFVAFAQFSKDRELTDVVGRRFLGNDFAPRVGVAGELKIAHFTDTFYEVNGVALTLRQQAKLAVHNRKPFVLVTCYNDPDSQNAPGVRNFVPIGQYELPEYPEQKIFYPPLLEMLEFCFQENIDAIHIATPGPVGLAALAIAKILKLPISGTYHTSIPQYTQILTGDETMEALAWKYVLWFYEQLDTIYAPSKNTLDELVEKGIDRSKIRTYPRGIDIERFNPAKRNGQMKKCFGIDREIKFLYVGRVSKEKNLHLLVEAFKEIVASGSKAHLVVVGDGPYLEELRRETQGLPCHYSGYLEGDDLPQIYASADIFVFPSTTDTFGNVVLEAQASGLPVIVTDQGGPCENILPGTTGLVVAGDSVVSLKEAMLTLMQDRERLRRMGMEARKFVETRSFDAAFLETWEIYGRELRGRFIGENGISAKAVGFDE